MNVVVDSPLLRGLSCVMPFGLQTQWVHLKEKGSMHVNENVQSDNLPSLRNLFARPPSLSQAPLMWRCSAEPMSEYVAEGNTCRTASEWKKGVIYTVVLLSRRMKQLILKYCSILNALIFHPAHHIEQRQGVPA